MALSLMAHAHEGARAVLGDRRARTIALLGFAESLFVGAVIGWGVGFGFAAGVAALVYGVLSIRWLHGRAQGEGAPREAASGVELAAQGRLESLRPTIAKLGLGLFALIALALGWGTAGGFAAGAALSGVVGYVGAKVVARAQGRAAEAARLGVNPAFAVIFRGGALVGLLMAGFGLLGLAAYYTLLKTAGAGDALRPLVGVAFGGSLGALFARLAGSAAAPVLDLFETYVATLVATMLLGGLLSGGSEGAAVYPLALGGIALLAGIGVAASTRLAQGRRIVDTLYKAVLTAGAWALALAYPITLLAFPGGFVSGGVAVSAHGVFFAAVSGMVLAALIAVAAEYHTGTGQGPVRRIIQANAVGPAARVVAGFGVAMKSTSGPVLALCACLWVAQLAAGLYGIAVAATAMLSLAALVVALAAYGTGIGGIAERAGLPQAARDAADSLDAVGGSIQPTVRAYAVGAAELAALALFFGYARNLGGAAALDLADYRVIVGLFIGGLLPYLFGGLLVEALGRAAHDLKQALVPSALPMVAPVLVGLVLGKEALGGMMVGVIVTGLFLAVAMLVGGAAWDSARKYLGGSVYRAKPGSARDADRGEDGVADIYKAIVGPAIPPLIKVVNIVALLIVSWL